MKASLSMKISPEIINMIPYKPGKPLSEAQREYGLKNIYKLASNENPLGPSPQAIMAIQRELHNLHMYPDPTQYELIQTVSRLWNISPEKISAGNGSDEIIDLLIRIYCEPKEGILTSEAAFAAYEVSAQSSRVKVYKVPLNSQYQFDLEKMAQYFLNNIEAHIHIIFIAHPNNPTGTYNSQKEVEGFLEQLGNRQDVLIVFDEAYTEFVRASDYVSAIHYLKKYNNVVMLRTFSKILGLAGLRVGIIVGPEEVIKVYNRVRKPFNVNHLAQVGAIAALQDSEFIRDSQQLVWKSLDFFYEKLRELSLPFFPSEGNFVTFDTLRDAQKVYEALLKKGIIMRPLFNYGFKTHLRLSCGKEEENIAAIQALSEVLAEIPLKL